MTEYLVAGGGLAGSAAAIALARAGREVVLLERTSGPADKICGEFLSTEAQSSLAALGVDLSHLGGHGMLKLRMVRGAEIVETPLPFAGLGLTRRALDECLLAHAAAAGVRVLRGQNIRRIDQAPGKIIVEADALWRPQKLFLATGKHEARGAARAVSAPARTIGFKTYFALTPVQLAKLSGTIELYLFPGGYAGLQRVENGAANFCLLVDQSVFKRYGSWPLLLAACCEASPVLAARLSGAAEMLAAPLSIARVPYGFLHRRETGAAYRLGDQAAVIHSFTGDGMSIALHSAALAAKMSLAGGDAAAYHRRLRADLSGQLRRAGLMHAAMRAPGLGAALFAALRGYPAMLAAAAALTRVPADARLT